MVIDSVVRQFLTLASEYWNVIEMPIASYGLIGSGMALLGLFVPRVARLMTERNSAVKNFLYTCSAVLIRAVWPGPGNTLLGHCASDFSLCFDSVNRIFRQSLPQ